MQDLLVTNQGLIFDTLNDDMVGLWDRDFNLKSTFKGILADLNSYQILPLHENKLLLSSETILYMVDLNDGTRRMIWDCNSKINVFGVTNHS